MASLVPRSGRDAELVARLAIQPQAAKQSQQQSKNKIIIIERNSTFNSHQNSRFLFSSSIATLHICEHPLERTVLKNCALMKGNGKAEFVTVNTI